MPQSAEFRSQIRSDKFYPPQVDTPQFIYRKRVIERLLSRKGARPPSILIEAQAGQGKTTVIKQFLDSLETDSVWYQVGPEDGDPSYFLQGIAAGLNSWVPDCPSASTIEILTGSGFSILDLQKRIRLLLDDLRSCLNEDLYLIFDDLHYLIPHEPSLLALDYLLEKAPPNLHFILSSRESLPLKNGGETTRKQNLRRLDGRDLALDEGEVTDLFHQAFQIDVPQDMIRKIARTTDGWIMGVQLLGQQIRQRQSRSFSPHLDFEGKADGREILTYFRREIFTPLEPRLHRPLLILSLLDEIPVDLAVELTGEPQIGADLGDLARRNLFVRQLDRDRTEFGFHHLFRQFLQEKAAVEFDPDAIREIYRLAGWFSLREKDSAQALRYLLEAEDYDAIEIILAEHGMSFLAIDRAATLAAILGRIPEASLRRQGWAPFYLATAKMDTAPAQALPLFEEALTVFTARQDKMGELLCLAHIISSHIYTTGDSLKEKKRLLRAEELFFQTTDALDPSVKILIARSLAIGHGISLGDFHKATQFASFALSLAQKEGLVNLEAAMLTIMGYIQIYTGRTAPARIYMEQAASLLHRPEIGTFNALLIRLMLLNFLFQDGDFGNYLDQKNQLAETVVDKLVTQSVIGPLCVVLEMDIAIHRERFEEALLLAEKAMVQYPSLGPHLRSQILQLQALALALVKQPEKALPMAEEARRLREISGRIYSVIVNKLVVALTLFHSDRSEEAIELLDEGIRDARRMPSDYLEACGLLHRAEVHLGTCAKIRAELDIERGLELMRRNDCRHLWAWTSESIRKILSFAVAHRIEVDYARFLAADRLDLAILDDGSAIPLLEIRTLGSFRILRQGVPLLEAEEITPLQRELLCLLISAPDCKLPQETIQLYLWPDSPRDAVNIKFDTLVSRLRKTMTSALSQDADIYLKREKGMLWLTHCRVDALDFLAGVNQGLRNLRLQEHWQAANAFTMAESLWRGEFAPGIAGGDQLREFREDLFRSVTELASAWSGLLAGSGRLPHAIRIVEKALDHDPLNDGLYTLLYRLQGRRSAVSARKVLKRLAAVFQREGYSGDEIEELVASITTARDPLSARPLS